MNTVKIQGYIPGAIGRIAEMHALYYHAQWRFGSYFEAKVATELSEFIGRFNTDRDGFWTACMNNRVQGSIAIDGVKADSKGAHLRWFIVSQELCGQGIGATLLNHAVRFCRHRNYATVYLWTFKGLEPARRLYEKNGFQLMLQQKGDQWGTRVNEQKYVLRL
jgi:GNAT superfamily N-acetyltransferase